MQELTYSLKIVLYMIFIIIVFFIAKRDSEKEKIIKNYKLNGSKIIINSNKSSMNFSKLGIIVCSVIFGLYSVIVSVKPYASDRGYYVALFGNHSLEYQLTKGYAFFTKIIYCISDNPDFLFFSVGFIIMLMALTLYRKYEHSNYLGLLLLLFSLYFIYTFHLLKQGIAIALGAFCITNIINKKFAKAVIYGVISVLFHESALILIMISMVLIGAKSKFLRFVEYFTLIIFTVGFAVFAQRFSNIIGILSPSLNIELGEYFNKLSLSSAGFSTAVKGLPVYIITIIAIIKRKQLQNLIKNYNNYMILACFTSFTYLLTAYMYWMYRFGLYSMFFVCMFFGQILENLSNKKEKIFYIFTVYGLTFFLTLRYLFQMFFHFGGF